MQRFLIEANSYGVWQICRYSAGDQDPFGLACRDIAQSYCLEEWEDGETFYLNGERRSAAGGGAPDGTVVRVGWNERFILAEQKAKFGNQRDWMIVDLTTDYVAGPYQLG